VKLNMSLLVVMVIAIAPIGACAGTGQYLQDRGADLSDIVRFQLIGSVGVSAKIEATQFVALGAGAYKGYAVGFANRECGAWHAGAVDLGLPPYLNVHRERYPGECLPMFSGSYNFNLLGEPGPEYEHDSALPSDWASLRVTAVLFVGADFQLRLNQVYDFFAGIFAADPLSDDHIEASAWAG
jgi:hypothetical protein